MKTNLFWTFPLLVLLSAGCQQKATTNADAVNARDTNVNAMAKDADNTARNKRDRADATLTPGDQGTTPADVELTQKVRKALVSAPLDFSVAAKNVKVITVNGKVTLRGPVKSEAEKNGVVILAKSIAGEANVEDQLEIKANP